MLRKCIFLVVVMISSLIQAQSESKEYRNKYKIIRLSSNLSLKIHYNKKVYSQRKYAALVSIGYANKVPRRLFTLDYYEVLNRYKNIRRYHFRLGKEGRLINPLKIFSWWGISFNKLDVTTENRVLDKGNNYEGLKRKWEELIE